MAAGKTMLVNLQGLRFLAALAVLLYHIGPHVWASGMPRAGLLDFFHLVGFGGVDAFFVISGFIMWHTTHDSAGPAESWRFMRRRFSRIYSGYWPFLLLAAALWHFYHPELIPGKSWLLSLTLIPNPLGTTAQLDPGGLILPVAWTLLYEMYFYIVFAVLIALRRRAYIAPVIYALLVVVAASAYALYSGVYTPERMLGASLVHTLYLSPFCAEFLVGCLLGQLYRHRSIPLPHLWLVVGVVLFGVTGWINGRWFDGILGYGYYTPIRVVLLSGAGAAMVLWVVALDQRGKVFMPKLTLLLGGSSYTLYLSHTLWLQWLYDIGVRDWLAGHGWTVLGYALAGLAIIVLSALFYQYAERPLHRGFRRLLRI